jgi:ubiquinone/menaquinone biosynthesis C-methylase UbiE
MRPAEYQPVVEELIRSSPTDARLSQFRTAITAHQYVRMYRTLTHHVPRGSRVLDWGTGSGHFAFFLARSGYRTSAFSLEEGPRICADLPGDRYEFTRGDLDNPVALPYESGSFDAVVSVGVLEHVRETGGDEVASLREIRRVLRPGGTFLCFHFPNRFSWIEAATRTIGRWHHQYKYTASDIHSLTRAAGLDLLDVQRYALLPRNVWSWGLPTWMGASFGVARVYDRVDDALGAVFSPICQNYLFVARRGADAPTSTAGPGGKGR